VSAANSRFSLSKLVSPRSPSDILTLCLLCGAALAVFANPITFSQWRLNFTDHMSGGDFFFSSLKWMGFLGVSVVPTLICSLYFNKLLAAIFARYEVRNLIRLLATSSALPVCIVLSKLLTVIASVEFGYEIIFRFETPSMAIIAIPALLLFRDFIAPIFSILMIIITLFISSNFLFKDVKSSSIGRHIALNLTSDLQDCVDPAVIWVGSETVIANCDYKINGGLNLRTSRFLIVSRENAVMRTRVIRKTN
jgi:hypothetical protein